MPANYRPSAACCSTPAVIGPPYEPKGRFIEVDGTKTYVSGPRNATKALFIIYDVFGFSTQILEGADKLAQHYQVFMPAFFGDGPAPLDWAPIDGEMDEAKLDTFCEGPGDTAKTLKRMDELRVQFQQMEGQIERWGLVGYCWGGYVANFAIGEGSAYKACAILHPGFPVEVASQITAPLLALCSKDEPESDYAQFEPALKVEHRIVSFPNMVHGWLSARGDLAKSEVRKEFDKGYDMMLEWFDKYL